MQLLAAWFVGSSRFRLPLKRGRNCIESSVALICTTSDPPPCTCLDTAEVHEVHTSAWLAVLQHNVLRLHIPARKCQPPVV